MDALGSAVAEPPRATARQRLREGTASLHYRIDAQITDACLSPRVDLPRLLAIHAHAFPPVAAGLIAVNAERLWPEWDGAARLAALSSERRTFHRASDDEGEPEPFRNDAMAWGGLYALLGSRLGNRLILRRLAEAGEAVESAFLRPGADDGREWRRFLDRLEAALAPGGPDACRDAIEGAARVMQRYLDAVERTGRAAAHPEECSR